MKTLDSVQQLIEEVQDLTSRSGVRWLYRGQTDANWMLQPTVYRKFSRNSERYLTQEFRARAGLRHGHRPRYEDYADWLALMQHYGLPTRLLDWSHSPLTAGFFAVENRLPHKYGTETVLTDAAIWAVSPGKLNKAEALDSLVYPLNSRELSEIVRDAFMTVPGGPEVAAALAVELDVRMQVQRGAFTVHKTETPLERIEGNEEWLVKWVIPHDKVDIFANQIDALGLGLADLFPDLGSLAKDLACRVPKA